MPRVIEEDIFLASVWRTLEFDVRIPEEALGLYDVIVTCGEVVEYRMDRVLNVVKVEFVTKTDSGIPAPMEFAYNTTPYPVIDVNVDSYGLLGDGTVRLVLSGTVTDAASDLVDDPAKQVGALEFYVGDELVGSVALMNEATPEPPWKPYKYAASFSKTVEFQVDAHGAGHHTVELVTSENVAGNRGTAAIDVTLWSPHISDDTYNLIVAEDPPGDAVVFYAGDREPRAGDPVLTRTGPDAYAGLLVWGHVAAEITDFAGLTGDVDSMNVTLTFTFSNGVTRTEEVTMVETAPETGRFAVRLRKTHPGLALGGTLKLLWTGTDTVQVWVDDGLPGTDDPAAVLDRIAADSFNGDAPWADTTARIAEFGGPTVDVDTMTVVWDFVYPDGRVSHYTFLMTETGSETNVFGRWIPEELNVSVTDPPPSWPGTFLPVMFRCKAAPGLFKAEDLSVDILGTTFQLATFDLGDGEYWYAVDRRGKIVVFLPAANAETHYQTQAVKISLQAGLTIAQATQLNKAVDILRGLVVKKGSIDAQLRPRISNYKETSIFYPDGTPAYWYTVKDPEQPLGHTDNSLRTEIYWRLIQVGADPLAQPYFVSVESPAELEDEIQARLQVVEAAKATMFGEGPHAIFQGDAENFWLQPYLGKPGLASSQIVSHMWTDPTAKTDYILPCTPARVFVQLEGIRRKYAADGTVALARKYDDVLVEQIGAQQLASPYGMRRRFIVTRHAQPPRMGLRSWTDWLPGDGGNLWNTHSCYSPGGSRYAQRNYLGSENIVYVGGRDGLSGCFEVDPGTSVNYAAPAPFIAGAYFWSHTYGIRSLRDMLELVDRRDEGGITDGTVVMKDIRYCIMLCNR